MINKNQIFIVCLLLIGVLDLLLWALTISHVAGVIPPIVFVLVRCGFIFGISCLFFLSRSNALILAILTSTLFIAFSFFGILAMLAVIRLTSQDLSPGGSLYHIDNEEGERPDMDDAPNQAVVIEELRRVSPLIDGMTDEDKNSRIAAIQAMERISDSTNIRKILLDAKLDPHKEVQYYANDALNKVNDGYMDRIKEQLDKINNMPKPDNAIYLTLADLYADVAEAKIDHPVLLHFYAQEAVKYYSYVLENLPAQADDDAEQPLTKPNVLKKFLPTLYNNNEFEKCLEYCEIASHIQPLKMISVLYQARCLFKLKKLAELKEFSRKNRGVGIPNIDEFLALEELR